MTLKLILPALILVLALALAVPAGAFVYAPLYPVVGQEVQFTDTSYDPDGSVVAWSWEFGDGGTSSDQNPNHTYTAPGIYSVIEVITDNTGISTTCRNGIEVTAACACDGAVVRILTDRRPRVGSRRQIVAHVVNRGPDACCFEVDLPDHLPEKRPAGGGQVPL
jgi:hypothetical protein